jgi:hypothetical protein
MFAVTVEQRVLELADARDRSGDNDVGGIGRLAPHDPDFAPGGEVGEGVAGDAAAGAAEVCDGPVTEVDPMVGVNAMGYVEVVRYGHRWNGLGGGQGKSQWLYRTTAAVAKFCSLRPWT